MTAKVIEMPKSNQQLWDAVFKKFISDVDKVVAAHYPEAYPGDPGPEPLAEAVTKEDL